MPIDADLHAADIHAVIALIELRPGIGQHIVLIVKE